MAHYALLDNNNIVTAVITGIEEDNEIDWEKKYSEITGSKVLRTSYNTCGNVHKNGGKPFRGNYAGIGFSYDESNDAFIPPKPFESWILNSSTYTWEAPVEHEDKGEGIWYWLETDPGKEGEVQGWNFTPIE